MSSRSATGQASVLFDAPGPATAARHRIYTVIALMVIAALIAFGIYRLWATEQFAYEKWEPFVTPKYVTALFEAWWQTLAMALLAVPGAIVFGLIFGVGKLSDHALLRWPSWLVVEFFRAVPVILLMIFAFYGVFNGFSIERGAFWSAILALACYNGAVLAEVFRAGINAVPKGQGEAAYAIGMVKSQVMGTILLPQAVKVMIPAIISQMVVALKDTSLILVVSGVGLTKFAKQLPLTFQNTVATTIVVTACYVLTNLLLTYLATMAQRRFVGEREMLKVQVVGEGTANAKPVA